MISNREIAVGSIQETDEPFGMGIGGTKVFKVSFFGALCVAKELSGTVKEDHIKVGNAQNDMKDYFLGKYQPLIQLRHPNIVQFMGIYFKPPDQVLKIRPVMVMEKLESSLSTFLVNTPSISNAIKVSMLLDVCLGLRYLHGQKPAVVHSNLSSNNILLTSQLQAKISDVGLMANQNQESPFMAPELRTGMPDSLLAKLTSDPSVDIFSFGAVVLHTITQQPPEPLGYDPVRQSVGAPTEVERLQSQINQVATRSKSLKSLVMVCLDNDPSKRPTISKISEPLKRYSDKLPIVSKSPIVWQAEVEAVSEQKNDLEKKLDNELKAKEQLQVQIEILLKLIQVNHSEFERIFKASEKNDSAKQAQVDQSQQISGSKLVKANSLQHCFSSSNASRNFQLVLRKDSSPNALNAAIEYAKFQFSLQDLPMADTKCPHHPNYELSKYCADCEVELCYLCSSNHQNHKVKFFSVLFVDHESTKSKIQQLLKEIETQKNKVDQKNREIQEKAKQSHEAVKMGFANIREAVNIQETKLLERLTLQLENAEKEYQLCLNICSVHVAQLKSFLNTMKQSMLVNKKEYYKFGRSILQHGNSLLRLGKDLKLSIQNELLEIPAREFESICDEIGSLGISPDAKMCSLVISPKAVIADKKETFVVIVKDSEGYTISNCKDKLTVEIGRTLSTINANVPTEVSGLGDGRYEVSYALKYSGEYNLKIKIGGVDIPETPCKITCKYSWESSFTPAIAPLLLPDGAISDDYQFKIKPIKNYGNNCYFNSVLQAFNQTTTVVEMGGRSNDCNPRIYTLKGLSHGDELRVSISGSIGTLHEKFQAIFREVDTIKTSSFIDPQSVLQLIAIKNPRFGRHTQEDSHELLRCLLTEMKNQELEKIGEKIHEYFGVTKDQSLASLDGEAKLTLKNYLRAASNTGKTPIEKVFSGIRLNTVICRQCHIPVQCEEPFFDVSLQIPDNAPVVGNTTYGGHSRQGINTWQSFSASYQYNNKQSPPGAHDGSIQLDADSVQSLLVAENMFHQPSNIVKHTRAVTGLEESLAAYTSVDNMDENNKFICTECSKMTNSEVLSFVCKQLLFHELPQALILHMKRFTIGSYTVTKNKAHVSFPPVLDIAPYSSNACVEKLGDSNNNILYGLYAVVEHMGSTLSAGHYVAYVRRRPKRNKLKSPPAGRWIYNEAAAHDGVWFHTSDLTIKECSKGFKEVERSEAYLLFYELLPISETI